jgi:hypothetical protein
MLLGCFALVAPTAAATKPCVETLFREYGLPKVLRSDNGEPFASVGLAGLTTLNVAWLKQGIRLERIRPASPQENGRHERMHRTLKDETTRPPKHFMEAQQRRFDEWRIDFNTQRPHEALRQAVPASRYSASSTSFREVGATASYPGHYEVRRVGNRGYIKLLGNSVHLSEALVGEDVGLVEVDDGLWRVLFLSDVICAIDLRGPTSRLVRDSSDD